MKQNYRPRVGCTTRPAAFADIFNFCCRLSADTWGTYRDIIHLLKSIYYDVYIGNHW